MPVMFGSARSTRFSSLAALVLVALLTACSASGSAGNASPSTSVPRTSKAERVVAGLAIGAHDVGTGERAEDYPGGRQVIGQVTLDYCGFPFPSEAKRTARRQVAIRDSENMWLGSNEVVDYREDGARQAVDEMRTAFIKCPSGKEADSHVGGVPNAAYASFPLDEASLPDVAADHVAARVTETAAGKQPSVRYLILQRRGEVMIGSYGVTAKMALALANAAGRRLAAADAADVGD